MTKAFNPRISDRDMFNDWLPGEEKLLKELDSMDPNNKSAKEHKDGAKLKCDGCSKIVLKATRRSAKSAVSVTMKLRIVEIRNSLLEAITMGLQLSQKQGQV